MHRTEKKGTNGYFQKKGMDTNKWLMQKKNSHRQTLVRMKSSRNSLWLVQQLWENVHQLLRKHTPAQRFCSQCLPKRIENICSERTCTRMFIAALFLTVENWKQPRCSSIEEWINYDIPKPGSSHSAVKRTNYQYLQLHE